MTLTVHLIVTDAAAGDGKSTSDRLTKIERLLTQMANTLDTKLSALTEAIAAETSVEDSIVVLLNGINSQLATAIQAAKDAGATAAQLTAFDTLTATVKSQTDKLAAAILANTPPPAAA